MLNAGTSTVYRPANAAPDPTEDDPIEDDGEADESRKVLQVEVTRRRNLYNFAKAQGLSEDELEGHRERLKQATTALREAKPVANQLESNADRTRAVKRKTEEVDAELKKHLDMQEALATQRGKLEATRGELQRQLQALEKERKKLEEAQEKEKKEE